MISAISNSLSGLQSATQRLNVAAEGIVKSGTTAISKQTVSDGQLSPTPNSGGPVRAKLNVLPDLTASLVDLKLAEFSYKASAKALKVVLEIDKNLIDQTS